MYMFKVNNNLLLTEREGRTGEYWPKVVAVQTERSEVRTKTTKGQYSPVRSEQVKLVSSLLYGITFYVQQHFQLFIQVNFGHDVREFPAYGDASSKNLLCFRSLNFPGAEW